MDFSDLLERLLNAKLDIGPGILWREIIGNGFGLASAMLGHAAQGRRLADRHRGQRLVVHRVPRRGVPHPAGPRSVGPGGPAGLLPHRQRLRLGTAGTSSGSPRGRREGVGVTPAWAGWRGRVQLWWRPSCSGRVSYFALKALGSWGPAADAWILTGSILATYGMARGCVEFWLIWIAVDLVGVPLLLTAGYYPSAIMYIVYGVFCVIGFVSWWRIERARSGHRRR